MDAIVDIIGETSKEDPRKLAWESVPFGIAAEEKETQPIGVHFANIADYSFIAILKILPGFLLEVKVVARRSSERKSDGPSVPLALTPVRGQSVRLESQADKDARDITSRRHGESDLSKTQVELL
jgi:hypothetical protein